MSKLQSVTSITRRNGWLGLSLIGLALSILLGLYISSFLTGNTFLDKLTFLKFSLIWFVQFCCLVATGAFYRRSFRHKRHDRENLKMIILGGIFSACALFLIFMFVPYILAQFNHKPFITAFSDAFLPGTLTIFFLVFLHKIEEKFRQQFYKGTTVLFVEIEQRWYNTLPEIRQVLNKDWNIGVLAFKHQNVRTLDIEGVENWDETRVQDWLSSEKKRGQNTLVVFGESLPNTEQHKRLIRKAYGNSFTMTNMANFYEEVLEKIPMFEHHTGWYASVGLPRPRCVDLFLKRFMDIIVSSLLLVLTAPLMVYLSFKIRKESKGSAFFQQKRLGYHGKPFTFFKLRTMEQQNSNRQEWENGKCVKKGVITPLGKKLRQSGLDELPQLISVLKGDMSMIGPRPTMIDAAKHHEEVLPFFAVQKAFKPGISGWAQLHQGQDTCDANISEKTRFNMYYAKNYSFGLDLLIYIRTFSQLVRGKKKESLGVSEGQDILKLATSYKSSAIQEREPFQKIG